MMKPSRVALQIKEALVGPSKSSAKKADLDVLAEKFSKLKSKIRLLIDALKLQYINLIHINESRLLVAERVASLADDSPVSDQAGHCVDSTDKSVAEDLSSYYSVHRKLSQHQRQYAERFLEHIVEYAVNWEKVIVSRVSTSLKTSEKLRRELDHYTKKVDSIQMSLVKGKTADKNQEKLARNTQKLAAAKKDYEEYSSDLSLLIEEVTARSWKDLHPILLKMVQFDLNLASDENEILSNLSLIDDSLRSLAHNMGLKPETRLKDLETLSTKLLTHKQNGDEPDGYETMSPRSAGEPEKEFDNLKIGNTNLKTDAAADDDSAVNQNAEKPFDEQSEISKSSEKQEWFMAYAGASAPPGSPLRSRSNLTSQESLYGGSVTSSLAQENVEVVETEFISPTKHSD